MFVVFEDVQKGIYKRSSLSDAAGTEKKNRPEMHIDGPLEIKGMLLCVHDVLTLENIFGSLFLQSKGPFILSFF